MRARRGQAQRPRQRRLHRPASHVLRNAGQFQFWRLFQGAGDPLRLGAGYPGFRATEGAAARHRLYRRRRRGRVVAQDFRPAERAHPAHRGGGQFLAHGRYRPVWPVLGNLLRPRTGHSRRAAGQPRGGGRPLHRNLEPGVHAVRGRPARDPGAAAAPLDRHRARAGAFRRHPAGQTRQLRHRYLARADPGQRRGDRTGPGRAAQDQPPHRRRPSAKFRVPDRRWRAALERGPRLRAAADHAPRHAPRPHDGRARAVDAAPRAGAGAANGHGLFRTRARPAADRGNAAAGGDPLRRHAGAWAASAGRSDRRARRSAEAAGRGRLPAATIPTASRSI